MPANLYIKSSLVDISSASRFSFFLIPENPAKGIRLKWKKHENVWAIHDIHTGAMRPAFIAGFPAEESNGSLSSESNQCYYRLTGSEYAQWDIPVSITATMDKLSIDFYRHVSGGVAIIQRYTGLDWEKIGSIETLGTDAFSNTTVTLDTSITGGDRIRFIPQGTREVRVSDWIAYASDNQCEPGDGNHYYIPDSLSVVMPGGPSVEMAVSMAPAGLSSKWVGGYYHNNSSDLGNVVQVNPKESMFVDRVSANITAGYIVGGEIIITRSSEVYHDDAHPNICNIMEVYELSEIALSYSRTITPTENLDIAANYHAMLPSNSNARFALVGSKIFDLSSWHEASEPAAKGYIFSKRNSIVPGMTCSDTTVNTQLTTINKKLYWKESMTGLAIGVDNSASWSLRWFDGFEIPYGKYPLLVSLIMWLKILYLKVVHYE